MLPMLVGIALALFFFFCVCCVLPGCCVRVMCKGGRAGAKTKPTRTAPAASSARRAPLNAPPSGGKKSKLGTMRASQRSGHARLPSEDVADAEEVGEPRAAHSRSTGVKGRGHHLLDDADHLSSDRWSIEETRRVKQAIAAKSMPSTKERFRALKLSGSKASTTRNGADETELGEILGAVDL